MAGGVRDLQFRRRRFLIVALATAVVFAMTLIMSGMSNGLDAEIDHIVDSFHADSWVVASGASGPFTATKFVVSDDVDTVKNAPGVRAASPMITERATIGTSSLTDVNLLGFVPGGVGAPVVTEGRAPKRSGEILVDNALDEDVGGIVGDQRHARACRWKGQRPSIQLRGPHGLHDTEERWEAVVRRTTARQRCDHERRCP